MLRMFGIFKFLLTHEFKLGFDSIRVLFHPTPFLRLMFSFSALPENALYEWNLPSISK